MKWPIFTRYFSNNVICIRLFGYGIKLTKQPLNLCEKVGSIKSYKITNKWRLIFLKK